MTCRTNEDPQYYYYYFEWVDFGENIYQMIFCIYCWFIAKQFLLSLNGNVYAKEPFVLEKKTIRMLFSCFKPFVFGLGQWPFILAMKKVYGFWIQKWNEHIFWIYFTSYLKQHFCHKSGSEIFGPMWAHGSTDEKWWPIYVGHSCTRGTVTSIDKVIQQHNPI